MDSIDELFDATQYRLKVDGLAEDLEIRFLQFNEDENNPLLEEYDKKAQLKFTAEIMDQDKFIKKNDVQRVSNPTFFVRNGVPTSDGLLSNEIFGITAEERQGIYAYIDLNGTYIDPSVYKAMIKVDPKIKNVVHGLGAFSINSKGELIEDPNGKSGIDWLKANIDKIKFRKNDSMARNLKIDYIKKNLNRAFIKKWIVIPAYYRDVVSSGSGNIGVGFINKMYSNLISLSNQSMEDDYYGLSKSHATAGRIQETLLAIYDYFSGNTNSMIGEKDAGVGLQGKFGIIRRSVTSKTADYACRLVITAPNVKGEKGSDTMVDLDHSAVPLSAAITIFYPFVLFNVRRFFEKEFSSNDLYPCIDSVTGETKYYHVKDPLIAFSDEKIKEEMKRFIHGNSNRIIPIEIPLEEDVGHKCYMMFKGRFANLDGKAKDENPEAIYNRRLTWMDVFYMAAVEACENKVALVTRYPMDSRYNQYPSGLVVSSTIDTEPMIVGSKFYKFYPKVRDNDIGKDTSNMFVDTFVMSNLYLGAIGGDYDGDTIVLKGVYTNEANDELKAYMDTKANYIDLGGHIIRSPSKEAIISMYSMTMKVSNIENGVLTDPQF